MRIALALFISLLAPVAGALADAPAVDCQALIEAGTSTAAKLAKAPASWTAYCTLQSGAVIRVSMLRSGDKERSIITVERGTNSEEVLRVISRDGLWYVTNSMGRSKYRPYEVPVDSPWLYIALGRAEPVYMNERTVPSGALEKVEAGVATYRGDLDPAMKEQLQAAVDQTVSMYRKLGRPIPAQMQSQMAGIKDLIAHGVPVRIDIATGQMIEYGTPKLRTRIAEFTFLDKVDDADFAVDGQDWKDCSDDPTAGNLDDLIMIAHAPGVRPGDKNYDLDGRLMDVKTGRFRRIPFPGGIVMPSCFLKDRRFVVVTGMDAKTGSLRPYQIDLKTRACTALGRPALDSGFTLFGDVSPDGKALVVSHIDYSAGGSFLNSQLFLIDLATGNAQPLGKPIDAAFVNWTADGRHLVMVVRKYKDLNSKPDAWVATMDMEGHVTELRRGDEPTLLADRQTILFEDRDTDLWNTCDLQGQNVKLFGDGLKGYGFPAPAPDGKRIFMMHFIPDALPDPVLLNIGESKGRIITDVSGLWGNPAWR